MPLVTTTLAAFILHRRYIAPIMCRLQLRYQLQDHFAQLCSKRVTRELGLHMLSSGLAHRVGFSRLTSKDLHGCCKDHWSGFAEEACDVVLDSLEGTAAVACDDRAGGGLSLNRDNAKVLILPNGVTS
eukprot:TRINITY_DN2994_c0_g1_i2.p2 TRINITY_DN2994_c0_g1~~TRINITY_DN2994_c0_g1_i2.p2  ORF type:complete len:128 (+),score=9.88 TRINITY_DN2994_c0_g1_i2:700-1083(+)